MSELKVASCFEFEKVLRGKSNKLFYPKSEVDAAIAAKDAEIRRLKRALYKACANWAWAEHVRYVDISDGSQGYKNVQERWDKMASKCRAKAEEYK